MPLILTLLLADIGSTLSTMGETTPNAAAAAGALCAALVMSLAAVGRRKRG